MLTRQSDHRELLDADRRSQLSTLLRLPTKFRLRFVIFNIIIFARNALLVFLYLFFRIVFKLLKNKSEFQEYFYGAWAKSKSTKKALLFKNLFFTWNWAEFFICRVLELNYFSTSFVKMTLAYLINNRAIKYARNGEKNHQKRDLKIAQFIICALEKPR